MKQIISYPAGFLKKLQIYGYEEFEPFIFLSLVTGSPVLFIGPHGTAKTLLAKRIADFLGLKFHAYDASKAMFEDMVGFPDPEKLKEGKLNYIRGDITLWDKEFILIDEISRALPGLQNKWLEIIRSRRLMGIPLKQVQFIFAAMNPPTYMGAMPLDEALADRFGFIFYFNNPHEKYLKEILMVKTKEDAPLLNNENEISPDIEFMKALGYYRVQLERNLEDSEDLRETVQSAERAWKTYMPKKYISPRRWKIIYYNLAGIKTIMRKLTPELVSNTIFYSLPFAAYDEEFLERLQEVKHLLRNIIGGKKRITFFGNLPGVHQRSPFNIENENDLEEFLKELKDLGDNWEEIAEERGWVYIMILKFLITGSYDEHSRNSLINFARYFGNNLPTSLWGIAFIAQKALTKSRSRLDEDHVLRTYIKTFLRRRMP